MNEHVDSTTGRSTVDRYFAAMRRGADAEDELLSLFTDDAEYVEPFSGLPEPAVGSGEIRERLRAGWETPLPDLVLTVLTIEVVGQEGRSTWECESSAFPAPVRGSDHYVFSDAGQIERLEVRVDLG